MNCESCEYRVDIYNGVGEIIKYECWRFPPQTIVTNHSGAFLHTLVKFPVVRNLLTREGVEFCYEYKEQALKGGEK